MSARGELRPAGPQGSFTKAGSQPFASPTRCHSSLFQFHPTPATGPVAESLFKEHDVRGLQILSRKRRCCANARGQSRRRISFSSLGFGQNSPRQVSSQPPGPPDWSDRTTSDLTSCGVICEPHAPAAGRVPGGGTQTLPSSCYWGSPRHCFLGTDGRRLLALSAM